MLVVEKDDNFMEDNSENVKMFLRDIVMPRIILGNTVLSECQTYHSYMRSFFSFPFCTNIPGCMLNVRFMYMYVKTNLADQALLCSS